MKKILLILCLAVLVSAISVGAACPSNVPVANATQAAFSGLSAVPANVSCRIWVYGAGNPTTAVGTDYGTMLTMALDAPTCAEFDLTHMLYQTSVGGCGFAGYAVLTDWNNASYDGCPAAASRVVILAEDNTGNFGIISRSANGTIFDNLDTVPTQAVVAMPIPNTITSAAQAAGTWTVTFGWTAVAAPLGGYAVGDAPAGNLISGYKVYIYTGAGAPPSLDHGSAGWALAATGGTVAGAATNTATVTFPSTVTTNRQYIALSLTTDSGFETTYTGPAYQIVAPTSASPIFNAMAAAVTSEGTAVNWTSGTETRVANYQVYWAPSMTSTFRPVGQPIAAMGTGALYNTNVRIMTTARTYFVKVRANMTDGSYEWSAPVSITTGVKGGTIQKGTPVRH